jgi:dihydroneopterin aldolase
VGGDVRGTIELTGLRARGHHGVYDFERRAGQEFVVDVSLVLDLAPAAASDDVADTVHYGDLARRLVEIVGGEPVNLLETLADRLLAACLADARVDEATVTVHKTQAPIPHEFADVSVTLTRGRTPAMAASAAWAAGETAGSRAGAADAPLASAAGAADAPLASAAGAADASLASAAGAAGETAASAAGAAGETAASRTGAAGTSEPGTTTGTSAVTAERGRP